MKFQVSMKDPDTLYDAIRDALKEQLSTVTDPKEREMLTEHRHEGISEMCSKWFRYGEYLTVEIDTEDGTCIVVPIRN